MAFKPPAVRAPPFASKKVSRLRNVIFRRTMPVKLYMTPPLQPHVVFKSDKPLLLLPKSPTPRTDSELLVFRWRNGRLERVKPVATVETQGFAPHSDFKFFHDVDVYPLDFPVEELVLVAIHPGRHARAHVRKHVKEEVLRQALETEIGKPFNSFTVSRLHTGLDRNPYTSLCVTFFNKECGYQLAPVVLPGWLTILDTTGRLCSIRAFMKRGLIWTKRNGVPSEVGLCAVYVPEKSDFVALLSFLARDLSRLEEASMPPISLLPEPVSWTCGCAHKPFPVAWRLSEGKLPEVVEEMLKKKEMRCETCVRNVKHIIEETGSEWT